MLTCKRFVNGNFNWINGFSLPYKTKKGTEGKV